MTAIAVGAFQIQDGAKAIVGFGSEGSVLVSGTYVLAVAYIVAGILLVLCGSVGAIDSHSHWKYRKPSSKTIELSYQCLLLMLAFICLVLLMVNTVALAFANNRTAYDSLRWADIVQSEPAHSCNAEKKLKCSGFKLRQCLLDNNETSNSFCPGHFCIDVCKIATDDVNQNSVCGPCRTKQLTPTEYVACKEHEKSHTERSGCENPLNHDLRQAYQRLLGIALICFLWISVTVVVASYKLCCV